MTEFRWFDRDFGPLAPGSMHNRAVVAGVVEFAPAHIVFRDHVGGRVVLAVRNEQVADLRQVPEEPESSALVICDRRRYGPGSTSQEACTYGVHTGRHSWERGGRA